MRVLSPEEIENSNPKIRDTSESIEEAETLFTETNKLVESNSSAEYIANIAKNPEGEPSIDWDSRQTLTLIWRRMFREINQEKFKRKHELLVIDRRKQKLSEWRKRLEQMQYDLTARESRILESEPFLPLARQLLEMKLALEDALPWIETIRERSEAENVDIRTTAINVAQELRLYRQFGGLQTQIQQAQGELKMLNMTIMQKQPVITTLLKLQQNGVKDDDIIGLSKILDLSRMAKEWNPLGPGNGIGEWNKYWQSSTTNGNGDIQQPVNPGSSGGNGGSYGGNFSVKDLISLGLLKSTLSTNTNMLKSARSPPGL